MGSKLSGKKIAILVTDGFEQEEMTAPRKALEDEGAETFIVSPKEAEVKGWKHTQWGDEFDVDVHIGEANAEDYDALLLPGGVMNPDKLRLERDCVAFVRAFFDVKKPVAAICHGPWLLIDAGAARGRRMTSWPSIRLDLQNAGAEVVDEEVVVDQGLVTSRKPADIPAFNAKMIEEIAEGPHNENRRAPRRRTERAAT
jgi:protease I